MGIILASASPRRNELLQQIGLDFTIQASTVEEIVDHNLSPTEVAKQLAQLKAEDVATQKPHDTVIGADTIVVSEHQILGKPKSEAEAKAMLTALSGSVHQVITGVAVINRAMNKSHSFSEVTEVAFKNLTEEEIDAYIATGEPMDKAGAYAIQGRAAVFVPQISGCYFNVVGLPLAHLAQVLEEFGD